METGENKFFVLQSDSFNIALASSYHLSIQIGITHFSYCLLNTTTFTYEYAKKYSISSVEDTATVFPAADYVRCKIILLLCTLYQLWNSVTLMCNTSGGYSAILMYTVSNEKYCHS